jgi:hypothetical protein
VEKVETVLESCYVMEEGKKFLRDHFNTNDSLICPSAIPSF